jgi:hypothetical protein
MEYGTYRLNLSTSSIKETNLWYLKDI